MYKEKETSRMLELTMEYRNAGVSPLCALRIAIEVISSKAPLGKCRCLIRSSDGVRETCDERLAKKGRG